MGSVGHTAQQSRKAAFHGPYMNLLDTLCHHKDFLQIQQRDEPDSKREYDRCSAAHAVVPTPSLPSFPLEL